MRNISPQFQARLNQDTTFLARAIKIERQDGVIFRLTEHDCDLSIGGEIYLAAGTPDFNMMSENCGLASNSMSLDFALTNEIISESDLIAGKFNEASIIIFLVDWMAPENFIQIWRGTLGSANIGIYGTTLELNGLKQNLNYPVGRVFSRACDAALGDARCGINKDLYSAQTSLESSSTTGLIEVLPPSGFNAADFQNGSLVFLSGELSGAEYMIYQIVDLSAKWRINLGIPLVLLPPANTQIKLIMGCDKSFSTCIAKFSNRANFRGCPFMPGDNVAFALAGNS